MRPPPPSQPFMPLFAAAFQLLMDRECLILGGHEKSRRVFVGMAAARRIACILLTRTCLFVFRKIQRYSWKYRWMLARGRVPLRARRSSFSCEPISRFRAVHHAAQSPSSSPRKFGQLLAYLVSYLHALLIACVTCSSKFRSRNGRADGLFLE